MRENSKKPLGARMFILLIRTVIIYIFLLITMRLMGKRQLGELEISELVSTLLLSDIAALPITNPEIPLSYALVPILAITTFEIVTSLLLTKQPKLKSVLSTRPSMIIQKGVIDHTELLKNRISIDELLSELRQKDVTDINEVDYAIIEQNGKMTVVKKADYDRPTRKDLGIKIQSGGLSHIIVSDGKVNEHGLLLVKKTHRWLDETLKKKKLALRDIYLMTLDDNETLSIVKRSQVITKRRKP